MKRHSKPIRYIPSAPSIRRHFSNTIFPSDWATPYLDALIDEDAPVSYGILMPGEHVPDGIPVIKVKDYVNGRLNLSSITRTSPEIDAEFKRSRVKAGDILLSIRGGTGDVIEVPEELEGANITQDTARLRANKQVSRNFLLHALRGEFVTTQIQLDTIGQAVTGINISSVRKLIIPLPPLPEQQKIADILGSWDEALEKLDALIAAKDRRKQALTQQLLSGGSTKKKWSRVSLSEVAETCSIRNGEKLGRTRLYAVTKAEGMVPMRENVQGATINRCQIVERSWFAYNPMRINIGSIARWEHDDPVMVSPDYVVFKTDETRLLSDYLNHVRRGIAWSDFVGAAGNGSVRVRIWFEDLGCFKFPLPSIPEQRAISNVLDAADAELRLLRHQRAALDQQKRGLMQKLLTGRIRVIK